MQNLLSTHLNFAQIPEQTSYYELQSDYFHADSNKKITFFQDASNNKYERKAYERIKMLE